jgi:hypothetical protein
MLEHLFLESPWALAAFFVLVAGVLLRVGRQRRGKLFALLAAVALALAVGVFVLARAVTTDRERLIEDTRALVDATAPLDLAALDRLIDPAATVSGPDGTAWLSAGRVRARLQQAVGRFGVNSQRVRDVQAVAHDTGWGESTVTVRTEMTSAGGAPVNTGWRLTWRQDAVSGGDTGGRSGGDIGGDAGGDSGGGGGWRVVDIRWMRFNGREVDRGMLP